MSKRNYFCADCGSTNISVYFPTPEPVARLVIEVADIRDCHRVLEPSAGTGNLARLAVEAGGLVDCIEIQQHMIEELERSDLYQWVHGEDFLKVPVQDPPIYDRVVMNPPFENGADMDHVERAIQHLRTGGILVAVVSVMAGERNRKRDKAFAAVLERHNAERLPPLSRDAFKEVGTNVATCLIKLRKRA